MRILVCVKRVPAPGARINITPDGQAIDTAYLGFTMSPHEECAVEEAVQLVERHGGEATVLTLGPAEADEQLRYAASLGVAKAVLLPIDGPDWDPQRTASAIAAAGDSPEQNRGEVDATLPRSTPGEVGKPNSAIRTVRPARGSQPPGRGGLAGTARGDAPDPDRPAGAPAGGARGDHGTPRRRSP